jgi:hypothetical protein
MKSKREISEAELDELREMFLGKGKIPEHKLLNAMDSSNLIANCIAHEIVTEAYQRVHPELDLVRVGEFLLDYYLNCIEREPPPEPQDDAELRDDELHRPYEAGRLLIGFVVNMWRLRPETDALIDDCVQRVTNLYLKSNQEIRLCIETAFLEHVFERPELRPLFAHWANHPELAEAHRMCMEWGLRFERPGN